MAFVRIFVHFSKPELNWYSVLESVHSKVMRWAELNMMKSVLAQQDISEGINHLHQRIDTCLAIYHVDFSPLNYVVKLLTFMEPLPGEG